MSVGSGFKSAPGTINSPGVYFIHSETTGLVKIGVATNIAARFSSIVTMSPVPLSLVGYHLGDARREIGLHRLYAALRSHGEWFKVTSEIAREMLQLHRYFCGARNLTTGKSLRGVSVDRWPPPDTTALLRGVFAAEGVACP